MELSVLLEARWKRIIFGEPLFDGPGIDAEMRAMSLVRNKVQRCGSPSS